MSELVVVGSFVQDLAFFTNTFPSAGESRIGRFQTGPGGKGFNQAVAANRLETRTLFIGAIGDDVFGSSVMEFAKSEKLQVAFEIHSGITSGAASVVINEKAENMIVVALGANEMLSERHIRELSTELENAKILLCQLESSLAATAFAMDLAKRSNVLSVLNPAPIQPDASDHLLTMADILVPNETEFCFLCHKSFGLDLGADVLTLSEDELHQLCRRFPNKTIVVTLGERGSFVSHAELRPSWVSESERNFYSVPAVDVQARDTTGAGDAFLGGFAAGLLRYPGQFYEALIFATTVAGLSTEKVGTAPAMPKIEEVQRRMMRIN